MVVAPLVFTLLVCAAADVGDGKRLGRIGIKTVIIFLVSTALAIVLGLVVSNMMNIGAGVELSNVAAPQPKGQAPASMLDTVINIIPVNIFASLAKQNLLQIIFFALIMGFALLKLGDKQGPAGLLPGRPGSDEGNHQHGSGIHSLRGAGADGFCGG